MGRPKQDLWKKYDFDNRLVLIAAWCRNGETNKGIARKLGIGETTLKRLLHLYPVLVDALKRNKEIIDTEVENALLKRAMGYEFEEKTIEQIPNEDGKGKIKIIKITKKFIPPDVTAQIFWLKNRKPKEWRDKQEIEGFVDHLHEFKIEVSDEKVKKFIERGEFFTEKLPESEVLQVTDGEKQ
jgi:hypothetical protein